MKRVCRLAVYPFFDKEYRELLKQKMRRAGMENDKIMIENGFEKLQENSYIRKIEEIVIFAQTKEDEIAFTLWCESVTYREDKEIVKYIISESKDVDYISAKCAKTGITVYCDISDEKDISQKIKKSYGIIKKVIEKFELVPVCSECGRRGEAEILCTEDGARMICGICLSEQALKKKHEEIKQSFMEKSKSRYIFGVIEKGTLVGCFFAGVKPALVSGAMGFVIFIAGWLIPYCYFMMCIPTYIGAYRIIRKVSNASHMPVFIRFILASFLYLIITGLLIFAGILAMSLLFSTGMSEMLINLMDPMIMIVTIAVTFAGYVSGAVLSFATDDNI